MSDQLMYLNPRTMKKTAGMPVPAVPKTADAPVKQPSKPVYDARQESGLELPENVILSTTNYAMFRFDQRNRPIDQKHVEELYDAVSANNLLHLFPIIVTPEMVVVDGQHRLKVAEALETPIFYIVSRRMRIEDAPSVTSNTRNWQAEDYLHHWCVIGLPEYLKMRQLLDDYPWLRISTAYQLAFVGDMSAKAGGGTIYRRFVGGKYIANNIDHARQVAAWLTELKEIVPFYHESVFVQAFSVMASHKTYNHDRFARKLEFLGSKLRKCVSVEDYLALFNYVYNYQQRRNDHVTFDKITIRDPEHRMHHLSHEAQRKAAK